MPTICPHSLPTVGYPSHYHSRFVQGRHLLPLPISLQTPKKNYLRVPRTRGGACFLVPVSYDYRTIWA